MPRTIALTQGKVAVVDDSDYDKLMEHKWCAMAARRPDGTIRNWYAVRGTSDRLVYMHRDLLDVAHGDVDHQDGDGLNNQRYNLRCATRAQNHQNRRRKRLGCSSMFKGVHWDRARRRWAANITSAGSITFLGRFNSDEDAACAYDDAARALFGEFASLNFPDRG